MLIPTLAPLAPSLIPSPEQSVWYLGPFPVRAYALSILVGIGVAIWLSEKRWRARGGRPGVVMDISVWAIPFGIIGGRVYHVLTTWSEYFGPNGDPMRAFEIWKGGLGIWGAVALGFVGGLIGARRAGVKVAPLADAVAPGIVLAQGIGRIGNWFNNELYGRATDQPWGLVIHQWDQSAGRAVLDAQGTPVVIGTFQPTFLYEFAFVVVLAVVLILLDRRFALHRGQLFGLYIMGYPLGRIFIEKMRTDTAELILGQRLNVWTSILVFLLGAVIFWWTGKRTRISQPETDGVEK